MKRDHRYSITEARANFPGLVRDAEAGFEVELTRHGKPVAVLISLREFERLQGERKPFQEVYKAFLNGNPLEEVGLDPEYFDSVRDRGSGRAVDL